jgi:hypothetical protein
MRVILLLFFFSSIVGCTKIQTTPRNQKDLIFDNWVVVYYEDLKLETVTTKDDVDSRGGLDVKIKFMDDSTFCGANTTNSVAGHYTISDGSFMINVYGENKSLKPTVTRVTPIAETAKYAPRYGGLVPPLGA